jgi:hypothetical protein
MDLADFRRLARPAPAAAAAAALLIAPAIAFGFGGGMHGGAHHGGAHPAPPPRAIDAAARAPFFNAPPPIPVSVGFHPRDDVRFRDRFGRERFGDRRLWTLGGPWGWGGYWGDEGAYAGGSGGPVYVQRAEAQAEGPAACPELITWQPKLGRATRQRLCDDVPAMRG